MVVSVSAVYPLNDHAKLIRFSFATAFRTEKPLDKSIFEQALSESTITAQENGGYAADQVHLLSDDALRQA